jgi:rSAM/selenodomain-associated transferase 1
MTLDYFGIFAKYWQPGKVKTRLAASIGTQAASDAYRAMVHYLTESLCESGDQRAIAYSPIDRKKEFANFPNWQQTPQSEGPLGARMASFFCDAFDSGAKRVVLIGSDCPDITPEVIDEAFQSLASTNVVLGPTVDGGYYLVGMSAKFHDIFSDITYSTESVLQETLSLATRNGITCHCLDQLNDIDEIADLKLYIEQLRQKHSNASASEGEAKLLKTLQHIGM